MRILLVFLVWSELAASFRLFSSFGHGQRIVIGLVFWPLTFAMLVGFRSRFVTTALGSLLLYCWHELGILGGDHTYSAHHVYTLSVGIFLLGFTACGGSYSIDRLQAVRRAQAAGTEVPPERGPLWGLWLIRLQIVAMYVFAAWDKSDPYFGIHFQQALRRFLIGSEEFDPAVTTLISAMAYGSVVLEWILPFTLLYRPTRKVSMLIGATFHWIIYWWLSVGTFSATVVVLYAAFLDPDEVHAFIDTLTGRTSAKPTGAPATPG